MDVDVDSVETELNAYTRVQQVPLDRDPLMWWKQHVKEGKEKKIHGSGGKILRAGSRTPVEGKRGRWADQPPDWGQ